MMPLLHMGEAPSLDAVGSLRHEDLRWPVAYHPGAKRALEELA